MSLFISKISEDEEFYIDKLVPICLKTISEKQPLFNFEEYKPEVYSRNPLFYWIYIDLNNYSINIPYIQNLKNFKILVHCYSRDSYENKPVNSYKNYSKENINTILKNMDINDIDISEKLITIDAIWYVKNKTIHFFNHSYYNNVKSWVINNIFNEWESYKKKLELEQELLNWKLNELFEDKSQESIEMLIETKYANKINLRLSEIKKELVNIFCEDDREIYFDE